MLQLLHPKLQALHALSRQHALIDAVSEISSQEEGNSSSTNSSSSMPQWLTPEYAYVAANADKIKKVLIVLYFVTCQSFNSLHMHMCPTVCAFTYFVKVSSLAINGID
jgi:hypothetical protein